ncbi:MAG TPA: hypothetical protein VMC84_01295 [Methanocella sp.]|uniref:hypothetical protein n=1 Tax=Methanocella sp. TaxID=2052833 RepID=UPI002BF4DDEA|nr:hypothetical protein [Methanocella sp.]HTY89789.1 hypothetical protein [Methanocella sp.]
MITVIFPHKTYSENKLKIKQIIKKYGMSWDDKKSGWVNEATGDGVFIDRSVMEMIMDDSFSENQPMTLFINSNNEDFRKEFEAKCAALGGQVISGGATPVRPALPQVKKTPQKPVHSKDIFVQAGLRDASGCSTSALQEKAVRDLKDISARWERRKRQLQVEYKKMGLGDKMADDLLQREEIAFRKSNSCWVTGDFPTESKKYE